VAERALLDTGVLVSFLHADDHAHDRSVGALKAFRGPLLTTEAVLTEAVYLLGRVRGGGILVPSSGESLLRCKALMSRYADVPMDFADATLVTLGDDVRTRRSTRWIGGGSRRIGPRQGRDSRFGRDVRARAPDDSPREPCFTLKQA
jgi:hypothetical protein